MALADTVQSMEVVQNKPFKSKVEQHHLQTVQSLTPNCYLQQGACFSSNGQAERAEALFAFTDMGSSPYACHDLSPTIV